MSLSVSLVAWYASPIFCCAAPTASLACNAQGLEYDGLLQRSHYTRQAFAHEPLYALQCIHNQRHLIASSRL